MKQSAKAITLTGLAGAAAFAGASQSYGVVVNLTTLPTNIPGNAPNGAVSTKEFYDVDTGKTTTASTASADLEFGYLNSSTYNESFTGVYALHGGSTLAYYASNGTHYAYGLAKGTVIGAGGPYGFSQSTTSFTIMSLTYAGTAYAIQKPNTPEYLGFEFTAADGAIHNGWLELESVSNDGTDIDGGLQFIAGAYNTTAGATITAGQTASAVPEPGTLSALALGAAGLVGVGFKRRKAARAAQA